MLAKRQTSPLLKMNGTQNVCRQAFWTQQAHTTTCCNLLKTSAGRCFGHTRHMLQHAVTCAKRLPTGVLDTTRTYYNMLQLAQNVCRQVFWTQHAHTTTCCNLRKTSAGRCFGHTRHIIKDAATCAKRLPAGVLDTSGTL